MEVDNYLFSVLDCQSKSEKHKWIESEHKGDYEYWGHGVMKQARCTKCGTIRYLQFEDTPIQTLDGKMLLRNKDEQINI